MNPNITDKALTHDIKTVCYHESGHLVALRELGGQGYSRLERVSPVGDNDKLASGRCHVLKMPDTEIDIAKVGLAKPTPATTQFSIKGKSCEMNVFEDSESKPVFAHKLYMKSKEVN